MTRGGRWIALTVTAGLATLLLLTPPVHPQEEVSSALRRYRDLEVSTGYYEEYEVLPRRQRPLVSLPGVQRGRLPYSPSAAAAVRIRTRLADSHRGLKFYDVKKCEACHPEQSDDLHTIRANLTCRQCHGGEPIASIDHYYSPMNPIRRHAYVCAKCHEGAGASFASYVIHPPDPMDIEALREFPVLYYAFWAMVAIAVGTFLVFLPHTFLWGIRELMTRKKEHDPHA
jgi:hypothetical protein